MMVVWGMTLLTVPGGAGAEEIGFVENFALAEDREAALNQLIPGTEHPPLPGDQTQAHLESNFLSFETWRVRIGRLVHENCQRDLG